MAKRVELWSRYVEGGGVGSASAWCEWIEVVKSGKGFELRAGTSQPHELRFSKSGLTDAKGFIETFERCVDDCFSEYVSSSTPLPTVQDVLGDLVEIDEAFALSIKQALIDRDSEDDEDDVGFNPARRPGVILISGLTDSSFDQQQRKAE